MPHPLHTPFDRPDADAILWATGFRPTISHLAPLRLKSPGGGIQLEAPRDPRTFTTSTKDGRIHFVGDGPSASTIGANRAGRVAALAVRDQVMHEPMAATKAPTAAS